MDFHSCCNFKFLLLLIFSLLCLRSRADGAGSVFFVDSPTHQYLRPSDATPETNLFSLPEVGAAVSVLLGFAPPATLSAASSDKLNEVLMPNPFDRPRTVFMLEISGVEDVKPVVGSDRNIFSSALRSSVIFGQNEAYIQLQVADEDEVSVVSLNERLYSDAESTDKELTDFASWLGGSYVSNPVEPLSGELTISLPNGVQLKLHMSKKADREFTAGLVSLIRNIRRAMEMHQNLSGSMHTPAELVTGRFDGIKALLEQYGTDGLAQQGVELFVASLSKIFDSLQTTYKGQIVGVILFNETPPPELETTLNVMFTSRPYPRWLEETLGSNSTDLAEVFLVRRTLAWITGIILLIATLLGIYFLLNMPLTRDTLLYSNVKLD